MKLSVIGMPIFYGCDRAGVEKGPKALRENNLINILEKNHVVYDFGDVDVEVVTSDCKYSANSKMKYLNQVVNANNRLASKVFSAINDGLIPFTIGGDHSLALGSIAGTSRYYGNDLGVIWIDAHGDINTDETSPSGNIHGMPLAASMGIGYKDLTSIFFDEQKVKPENVFIIACRDLDKGELELIDKLNMNVWNMDYIKENSIDIVIDELLNKIREKNIKNIHLSYDIDCLDPKYVPGTGTPVDDGLTFEESHRLLRSVLNTSLIKAIDFVEYNPDIDIDNKTSETCIELLNIFSDELK